MGSQCCSLSIRKRASIIDVRDYTRSVPLPPFPDSIRFPTLAAFLDSIIEDHLNPSQAGYISSKESYNFHAFMSYICLYTLRHEGPAVLPNGDLYPNCVEVMQSLRPENRSIFEDFARMSPRKGDIAYHVKNHKDILRAQGYVQMLFSRQSVPSSEFRHLERANRPRPLPLPGNPALMY